MRLLGFLLALLVSFVAWGTALALSGGVAPLGKTGAAEGIIFFTPVVVFVAPLALGAVIRGHALAGIWAIAVAPVFGFLNFALAASAQMVDSNSPAAALGSPSAQLLVWVALLVLVLGALALLGLLHSAPTKRERQSQ